jgi:flagellin
VAVRIGSNISSLQAQRRVGEATSSVGASLSRLSSGQRVNRASDDAAGLAIADTLRTRRTVYDRGAKNVSDGVSLLTIADSAIGELAGLTTRILELAEQGANGVYSVAQRKAMDTEAQRLRDEFLRISRSTQFNGLNLFDGSIQGLRIQAGLGVDGGVASSLGGKLGSGYVVDGSGQTILGNVQSSTVADFSGDGVTDVVGWAGAGLAFQAGLGNGTFSAATTLTTSATPYGFEAADFNNDGALDLVGAVGTATLSVFLNNRVGGFNPATSVTTGGAASLIAVVDANSDGRMDIVTATNNLAGNDTLSLLLGNGSGGFAAPSTISLGTGFDPNALEAGDFNGDGVTDLLLLSNAGSSVVYRGNGVGGFTLQNSTSGPYLNATVGDFNGDGISDFAQSDAGTVEVWLGSQSGTFTLSSSLSGNQVGVGDMNGDSALDIITTDGDNNSFSILLGNGSGGFSDSGMQGVGFLPSIATGDVDGDGVTDIVASGYTPFLGKTRDGINPIQPFSLLTQADARQAIAPLTRKLEELSKQRGVIGAFQSRLASASLSASSQSDGFRAAESRIRDVDVAQEAARLVGSQIRQQAATAVLAQANLQPSLALQLLAIS